MRSRSAKAVAGPRCGDETDARRLLLTMEEGGDGESRAGYGSERDAAYRRMDGGGSWQQENEGPWSGMEWLGAAGKEAGTGGAALGLGGLVRWGWTKAACSGQWTVGSTEYVSRISQVRTVR